MKSRYVVSSLVALIAGFGFLPDASAYTGAWCSMEGGTSNAQTPECSDSPGYGDGTNLGVLQDFIYDACGTTSSGPGGNPKVDFVVTYPDPVYYSGSKKFPLVVLQHGGGLADTFYDKHSLDTSPGSHRVSPYEELSMTLAHKGAVVITAGFNESSSVPYDSANTLAAAIGCFNDRVNSKVCTTSTVEPCFSPLMDKVSAEMTFVGHSSGGVIGLYLPEHYKSGIRGIIMLDPAKGSWLNQAPKTLASAKIPIVHMYPDFYGPARDANNGLFRLGFPKTCSGGTYAGYGCRTNNDCGTGSCSINTPPFAGPWIPLGIRELPTGAGGPNPNTGHHEVHHCMGMSNAGAFNYFPPGHEAFCNTSMSCTKPSIDCGGQQYCGPQRRCIVGIKNAIWNLTGADLQTGASYITRRYVAAYSACFGADYGHYYQSWVNGMDRNYDDAGDGRLCTKNGYVNSTCGAHTDWSTCATDTANECLWANAQDKYCVGGSAAGSLCYEASTGLQFVCTGGYCSGLGKMIRINNGQTSISDYGLPISGDSRYYTTLMSNYSSSTGRFDEQTERLGTTQGAAYAPACGAMTSFF